MSAFQLGNYGNYHGDSLAELIDYHRSQLDAQIKECGTQILEYVRYEEYAAWIDNLPSMSGADLLRTMQTRLDHLETEECSCTDPERTCPACRHAAYRQWYMKQGE